MTKMIKKIIDVSDKIIMSVLQEIGKIFFWILILYFMTKTFLDFDILEFIDLDSLPDRPN